MIIRLRRHFPTLEGAEDFADNLRATGGRDVVVVPAVNAEDKARAYENPRVDGAVVVWTGED